MAELTGAPTLPLTRFMQLSILILYSDMEESDANAPESIRRACEVQLRHHLLAFALDNAYEDFHRAVPACANSPVKFFTRNEAPLTQKRIDSNTVLAD